MTDVLGLGSWEVGVTLESRNNRSCTSTVKPSAVHRKKKTRLTLHETGEKHLYKIGFYSGKISFLTDTIPAECRNLVQGKLNGKSKI